jgi:hypothetical protein
MFNKNCYMETQVALHIATELLHVTTKPRQHSPSLIHIFISPSPVPLLIPYPFHPPFTLPFPILTKPRSLPSPPSSSSYPQLRHPNDFKHPNPTQSIHNFPSTQPCPYQHQLLPSHPRPELNPCPQTPSKHSTSAPQERPNYAADVDAVVVGSQDFAVDGESPDPILWGRG